MSERTQAVKKIQSGYWQLNALGLALLGLLALTGWWLKAQPFSIRTALPMAMVGYAAWRIFFELTINRANIPTLATSWTARKKIAVLIAEDAKDQKEYIVLDLGSGRGELTRRIACQVPHAHIIGIETAPVPYMQSQLVRALLGPANLSYQKVDFWTYDCTTANTVVLYLNLRLAKKAGEKLAQELKLGMQIISYNFPLQDEWVPAEIIEFRTPFKETIYVYRKS
jgi:hypothetical protein